MLRVLGILAGLALGALAGLLGGGLVGGLAGLVVWPIWGASTAWAVGVSLGGLVAMAVAVAVGVWAGALSTLGQDARRQSSFTWWVVNRLLFLAAVTSVQMFATYFLMYTFNITRETAASMNGNLMMVVGIFTLFSALPGGWLSDRFGHQRLVGLSGVIAAGGAFLLVVTIWMPLLNLIYAAGCIIGLAVGLFTATNWALGTSLVPAGEAGRYLGISNLAGAGAGMIGAGIGGPVADFLNGISPGLGYFVLFACYGILFILSAISLKGVGNERFSASQS